MVKQDGNETVIKLDITIHLSAHEQSTYLHILGFVYDGRVFLISSLKQDLFYTYAYCRDLFNILFYTFIIIIHQVNN